MTDSTWAREFYPIAAVHMLKSSDKECLEHSLRKWVGLRDVNLTKHLVKKPHFPSAQSCALCVKHLTDGNCNSCPICKIRDNLDCGDPEGPYQHYQDTQDPEPMIELLTLALDLERKTV